MVIRWGVYPMNTKISMPSNQKAGNIYCFSTVVVPGILSGAADASVMTKQWKTIFDIGKGSMPKFAAVTLLSWCYLAYSQHSIGQAWRGFLGAGILTIAIVPYTLIVMTPTNSALMAAATGVTTMSDGEARRLL